MADDHSLIKQFDISNRNSKEIVPHTRHFLIITCQNKALGCTFSEVMSCICANLSVGAGNNFTVRITVWYYSIKLNQFGHFYDH